MNFPIPPLYLNASTFRLLEFFVIVLTAIAMTPAQAQNIGSAADGFDPNADHWVWSMAEQSDGKILVGGGFTTIGGQTRNGLARLHSDGSVDTAFVANLDGTINPVFNPFSNNWVLALAVQADGKILVGGGFTSIGGSVRNGLARLNANGTVDSTFNPNVNGSVMSIAVQEDGAIVIGGFFDMVGGVSRSRIARLNSDGSIDTAFDPGADAEIEQLAIQEDGKIIAVGGFTSFGGATRNRIARVHADGTLDAGFDPSADGAVYCAAIQLDGKILIGGPFTAVGGVTRNHIARLEEDGTLDTGFNPSADDNVEALSIIADGRILVSGAFSQISGQSQNHSAILLPDGTADSGYSPTVGSTVRSQVAQADGKALLGGQFTTVGGEPRNRIARVHADGSLETDFNPGANNIVRSFAIQGNGKIVAAGGFSTLDGQTHNRIARLEADGSLDSGFNPGADSSVECVALQRDGKILVGGQFTMINGSPRNHIARLNPDGTLDNTFNPGADNSVSSILVQPDGRILVGGYFTIFGGVARNKMARLSSEGVVDTNFNPGVSGDEVFTMAFQNDGKILVGGRFSSIAGLSGANIARLNADGSVDPGFTIGANDAVQCLSIQPNGKVIIGGLFSNVGGQARSRIARLETDGSLDSQFNPTANHAVWAIAIQENEKVVVGGFFTGIGGQTRNYIARLESDGTVDSTFNPAANDRVVALAIQSDGKVLAGGFFSAIGGQSRSRVARLNNTTATGELELNFPGNRIKWNRGGSSPIVDRVEFDQSFNGGGTWSSLGVASRDGDSGAWELTGLSMATEQNILIRARGFQLANSEIHGASSIFEATEQFYLPPVPPILINEVDAVTQSGDTREFIELYDGGLGSMPLDDLVVILFNGGDGTSYHAIDLDGHSTDANGYFVIGNGAAPNVDLVISDGTIQNGSDAVAIYAANAADFPNGTAATTTDLIDAVVYDSGQADNAGLLALLNANEPQLNENENSNAAGHSLQRLPNGDGGILNTSAFSVFSPTPGLPNTATPIPGTPDLTDASDSGDSNSDDLTKIPLPDFSGTARTGALVSVSSDVAGGVIATGVADLSGNWTATVGSTLAEGTHQITATADGSSASGALSINIDTTPPAVPSSLDLTTDSGVSSTDNITNDNTPGFTGLADAGTTVQILVDAGVFGGTSGQGATPWTHTISGASPLAEGSRSVTARSIDPAGNASAASTALDVIIDTTVPTLTVNQASGQADPASAAPVNFDVVFSENIIGFTSGDVSLGGTASPSSPSLSGGPANYTATAGVISGEGTVTATIAAAVATDTAGNANEAGSSIDNVVVIDSHGGTTGTATEVTLGGGSGTASGWLEAGDTDVFSFTITEPKYATIETSGSVDTLGRLKSAEDNLLNDPNADDDSGVDENFRIHQPLAVGTYTVEVSSKGATTSGAYQLEITLGAMVTYQPDSRVGPRSLGNGVYETPAGQTLNLISKKARTVRGVVSIENDGELPDDFIVRGTKGKSLFKVIYTSAAGNVTASMVTGTYETGTVDPGESADPVKATIKPNKRKLIKKIRRGGKRKIKVKKRKITLTLRSLSRADSISSDFSLIKVKTK